MSEELKEYFKGLSTKEEVREALENGHEYTKTEIAEEQAVLDDIQKKIDALNAGRSALNDERIQEQKKLYDALGQREKELLAKKAQLDKKKGNCRLLGWAILGVYLVAVICLLFVAKVKLPLPDVAVYLIAAALGIILYAVPVSIKRAPFKRAIAEIDADPQISEYNKKRFEIYKEYESKITDNQGAKRELEGKASECRSKLRKLEEQEKNDLYLLSELDFNWEYKDTILFYGKESGAIYDLYIDGVLYDRVKRHKIIPIKLDEGLHSFKVEYTVYNIDKSVIYSYSFQTAQFEAGAYPQAYPVVCDFKSIELVSGEKFQKVTKTKLI